MTHAHDEAVQHAAAVLADFDGTRATMGEPRTRHWIEVFPDEDRINGRLVCEHPDDCRDTSPEYRRNGCCIKEWVEATSIGDLLHWPAGDLPVIGRLEIAAKWIGDSEDADLTLTKPANAGPIVICGSTSQLTELAALAATYTQDGREVLYPQDSDRPGPDLDQQWMQAIPGASLVVVLRKPDGSIGSQAAEELACAVDHGVPVRLVSPKEGSDG